MGHRICDMIHVPDDSTNTVTVDRIDYKIKKINRNFIKGDLRRFR